MVRILTRLRRRPTTRTGPTGPAIQYTEQQKAKNRLLALARQRQAEYRYDRPGR